MVVYSTNSFGVRCDTCSEVGQALATRLGRFCGNCLTDTEVMTDSRDNLQGARGPVGYLDEPAW